MALVIDRLSAALPIKVLGFMTFLLPKTEGI
jgi:hypothetical protein